MIKNTLAKAIDLAFAEFRKEFGDDAKLEELESFVTVFNDGVLELGVEKGEIKINLSLGKPYFVNYDLNLLEEKGDK